MKKLLLSVLILFVLCIGCTRDDIRNFVKDPHFTSYKDQLDNLESAYLRDEISYPVYLKRKKEIEDTYTKEVQEREDIIHSGSY